MNLKDLNSIYCEPFGEYKSRKEFISPSDIKGCKTPKQYFYNRQHPRLKETEELIFGNYFHSLVLEPDKTEENFAIWKNSMKPEPDKNYTSVKNRQARDSFIANAELQGKKVIGEEFYEKGAEMIDSIKKSTTFMPLFNRKVGIMEYSFLACARLKIGVDEVENIDNEYELEILNISKAPEIPKDRLILLKCRPDYVSKVAEYIADVKTAMTAAPTGNGFSKHAYNFEYHIQAAMYIDIVKAATGKEFNEFYFGVVEKEPPYDNQVYRCTEDLIYYGRLQYQKRLIEIKLAENSGVYKSYDVYSETDTGLILLDLPHYGKLENYKF